MKHCSDQRSERRVGRTHPFVTALAHQQMAFGSSSPVSPGHREFPKRARSSPWETHPENSSIRGQLAWTSNAIGIRIVESTCGECGSSSPVQTSRMPFSRLMKSELGVASSSGVSKRMNSVTSRESLRVHFSALRSSRSRCLTRCRMRNSPPGAYTPLFVTKDLSGRAPSEEV